MVVKRGPSERLSLIYTRSSLKRFFQGLTDRDPLYKHLITFPFLLGHQVLV